jgi:hypothetical protein
MRPPYTMNMNLSIGREFKHGLFMQGSYVGRLSRRSLAQTGPATPVDIVDPASGMDYYQAATQIARLVSAKTPVASVPKIPYWENMWNGTATLTATQYVYSQYQKNSPDYSTALENLDRTCSPCLGKLGPYAFFDRQFASITAFGFITNPWNPAIHKAVSDYDMTHQWNANFVAELPFGKGKRMLNRGGVVDALLGGWQLSGIYRQTTGMPISMRDGSNWPTNYQWQAWATMVAPMQGMQTTKNAPAITGKGGPNVFADPKTAISSFDFTLPGGVGNRNVVRSDGYFTIDTSLGKRFRMPYSEKHSLQIRWETFNLTNTARFDMGSLSINLGSPGTFGKYSGTLTSPRVMQFGARYEW